MLQGKSDCVILFWFYFGDNVIIVAVPLAVVLLCSLTNDRYAIVGGYPDEGDRTRKEKRLFVG